MKKANPVDETWRACVFYLTINFDALAADDEDNDEDAAASEEHNDNGIKMYQVWSDQFMIPPNHINVNLVSLCFLSRKKKQRTFRPQNGQVARGKTVMIAGHGAFGVENVGNAEVQITVSGRMFQAFVDAGATG